jgi:cell filamentation protein
MRSKRAHGMNPPDRYDATGNIEAEYEPGTSILRNIQRITDQARLDRLEFEVLVRTQEAYYGLVAEDTPMTNGLLCEIHRHWLGDIYEWAGRYRTVNLTKGDFRWPPPGRIAANMASFEERFLRRETPCAGKSLERTARSIAIVQAEFLLIHPFRDGNGRLIRLVANLMALQAGFAPMDYGFEDAAQREMYIAAVRRGYLQDYAPLEAVVKDAIRRGEGG